MSAAGSEAAEGPARARHAGTGEGAGAAHHARTFKLRFAAQREPGRSYVSLVKPLSLPATVTDKFYSRGAQAQAGAEPAAAGAEPAAERRALARVRDLFRRGPRETLPAPLTESHVYGWWSAAGAGAGAGRAGRGHGLRDSAWLRARLRVLAADLQQRRA